MGKHNLGIFYFKKALQENDHTCAQLGDGSNGQCKLSQFMYLFSSTYQDPRGPGAYHSGVDKSPIWHIHTNLE